MLTIKNKYLRFLPMMMILFSLLACKHEVDEIITIPANLIYNPSSASVDLGTAGNSATPTVTGGGAIQYSLGSAPAGVTIDANTGVIKWASAVAAGTYNLVVTVSNSVGSINTTYVLKVTAPLAKPSNLIYTPNIDTTSLGIAGQSSVPTINNGGATVTFTITSPPTGFSINAGTGVISWSNTIALGTYSIAVVATNSVGSFNLSHTVFVNHILFIPNKPE